MFWNYMYLKIQIQSIRTDEKVHSERLLLTKLNVFNFGRITNYVQIARNSMIRQGPRICMKLTIYNYSI